MALSRKVTDLAKELTETVEADGDISLIVAGDRSDFETCLCFSCEDIRGGLILITTAIAGLSEMSGVSINKILSIIRKNNRFNRFDEAKQNMRNGESLR